MEIPTGDIHEYFGGLVYECNALEKQPAWSRNPAFPAARAVLPADRFPGGRVIVGGALA